MPGCRDAPGMPGMPGMPGTRRAAEPESADPHEGVLDLQEEVLHAVRAAARQDVGRLSVLRADGRAGRAAPAKLQKLKTQAFVHGLERRSGQRAAARLARPAAGPAARRAVHARSRRTSIGNGDPKCHDGA